MKKLLITTLSICTIATTVFAGHENEGVGAQTYNPAAIYKALKVKEVKLNAGIAGAGRFEKSVGGLSCVRSVLIVRNTEQSFECSVDQRIENFAAIYKALKVKEVKLNAGIAGASRSEKSVGGLTCVKSVLIIPDAKPTFECAMVD